MSNERRRIHCLPRQAGVRLEEDSNLKLPLAALGRTGIFRQFFQALASVATAWQPALAIFALLLILPPWASGAEPAEAGSAVQAEPPAVNAAPQRLSRSEVLLGSLTVFVLAVFLGFEIISKVPTTLHTPLMSGSNAISGITVVGALMAASLPWGETHSVVAAALAGVGVALGTLNAVGGFAVTHRMLRMFQVRKPS